LRDAELGRLALDEARHPFDLRAGFLMRLVLLRCGAEEHALVLAFHHIIADGWSLAVFQRELTALYSAFSRELRSPLPELPIRYRDFAVWQRGWLAGEHLAAQLAYWSRKLAGAPARLRLPTNRPRSAVQTSHGAVLAFRVDAPLTAVLRALGREAGVTLFMVLLTGFKILLRAFTGQEDLVVCSHIANRRFPELEGLIGYFVNTLVLRTKLDGDPTCRELLARVRETTLGAYAHQDLPFSKLVETLAPERDRGHPPLFQVARPSTADAGLKIDVMPLHGGWSKFDLDLEVQEVGEALEGLFTFNAALFEPTTAARMLGHYRAVLQQMVDTPDSRLSALALPADAEAAGAAADFNVDLDEEFG
jgi:hypothetical protein